MIMKIIKWFKSLFKCNKVKENSTVADECQKMMAEYPVTEEIKEYANPVANKPVKKSKKRGRPRKKKKEE